MPIPTLPELVARFNPPCFDCLSFETSINELASFESSKSALRFEFTVPFDKGILPLELPGVCPSSKEALRLLTLVPVPVIFVSETSLTLPRYMCQL